MEESDVRMKFLLSSKLWICETLDNARAERYIDLIENCDYWNNCDIRQQSWY